jgi:hypothetical protein
MEAGPNVGQTETISVPAHATERAATPIDSVIANEVLGLMTWIFIRSLPFG